MGSKTWDELYKEAGNIEPITAADYDFQVQTAEHKMTQGSKDMYVLKCIVTTGPHKGKMVWHNQVVSPESQPAMEVFFRQMDVLGLDGPFWKSKPTDDAICARLKGAFFKGSVAIETYNGTERPKIKTFKRATGAVASGSTPPPPPPPPVAPAPPAPPVAAPAPAAAAPPPPPPPVAEPAAPAAPPVPQPAPATLEPAAAAPAPPAVAPPADIPPPPPPAF